MSESVLAIQPRKTSQEIAASASAALAKATIEAKFVIALQRPRSIMSARSAILDACKRPAFAEGAMYRKKQGSKQVNGRWEDNYIEGLSIRFAEQALNAWRNVDVTAVTAWEDENARLIRITVTDLETNLSYSDEAMLQKTVERKKVRDGQDVIGERETSDGGKVFIVRTTDEEMANKVNAAKSKAIRNSGLRLIPQDILEEAEEAIRATKEKGGGDPKAQVKKVIDAFGGIGVPPNEIEAYLGHPIEQASPKEIIDLRSIFTTIRDGEARWTDYRTKEEAKSVEVKVSGSESITRNTAPPGRGIRDPRGGLCRSGICSPHPTTSASTPGKRTADEPSEVVGGSRDCRRSRRRSHPWLVQRNSGMQHPGRDRADVPERHQCDFPAYLPGDIHQTSWG